MAGNRIFLLFALLLGVVALWKMLYPTHTLRYRLTIVVAKDGLLHSGSSVVELKTTRNFFLSALEILPRWSTAYRGEATFVDLGDGQSLFVLLGGENSKAPTAMFPARVILGEEVARRSPPGKFDVLTTLHPDRLAEAKGRPYPLDLAQVPPMIRFRQIDDPSTVERVDPNNLAASFGPGVTLQSVRLEITDDEVTETIYSKLPWLARLRPGKALSGREGTSSQAGDEPNSTPNHFAYWHFKRD